jgi:fluoride exporter
MKSVIIIGVGGGLGSILRYIISLFVGKHVPLIFPLGTFLVNVSGCFLIGMFYSLAARHTIFEPDWRLFLVTGFCGGYTTFSTFSYDGLILLKQGAVFSFMLYALGSIVLGLLATFAGVSLFK